MRVSAADSACDVSARAGAEDGQFACAVATAVRAESPRGRQTASATHMTSCIQLEYVASLIGARSRRLVAASATPAAVCLKSAKVRVFEAKYEQIAQAYGLVMS